MEFYRSMAKYYDLQYKEKIDDIKMYERLARRAGKEILELACGTGRVLIPLARAGFNVVGIDNSEDMLAIARMKLRKERMEVRKRVKLVKGDMRDFNLKRHFDMAFIAFSSFLHQETVEDEERCLRSVWKHLRPGGILVIDVFKPDFKRFPERTVSLDFARRDEAGNLVCRFSARTYEHEKQHIHLLFLLDIIGKDGKARRYADTLTLRYVRRMEMKRLLKRCGYEVEKVYGWYDFSPYTVNSKQQIFVARKKSKPFLTPE